MALFVAVRLIGLQIGDHVDIPVHTDERVVPAYDLDVPEASDLFGDRLHVSVEYLLHLVAWFRVCLDMQRQDMHFLADTDCERGIELEEVFCHPVLF